MVIGQILLAPRVIIITAQRTLRTREIILIINLIDQLNELVARRLHSLTVPDERVRKFRVRVRVRLHSRVPPQAQLVEARRHRNTPVELQVGVVLSEHVVGYFGDAVAQVLERPDVAVRVPLGAEQAAHDRHVKEGGVAGHVGRGQFTGVGGLRRLFAYDQRWVVAVKEKFSYRIHCQLFMNRHYQLR